MRELILACILAAVAWQPAFAEDIVGRATVIDGDVGAYRCGKAAAFALDRFLAESRPTRCSSRATDIQRFVGVCFRADGREVNNWLVGSGNAVDWSRYSNGAYADAQQSARSSGVGVWRGHFELPCRARAERIGRETAC
ncbi:thermonuclease family protein (plasmid) [Sinorhizobium terangae]|nr:thermonuclease family protein [Sinorhizobium terangae]WFU51604.1 thermonuclease family protein [Sinorhizobium terangae]